MKRRFFISIIISVILAFSLIIAIDILINTPTGLKWAIWSIEKRLPGQLEIAKISGSLRGPFSLENIHYQYKNNKITIKKIIFNWQPLKLLKNEILINKITIDDLSWQGANKDNIKLNVQGNFDKQWNLNWKSRANLEKNIINARGIVQGALMRPQLQAEIDHFNIPELGLHLTNLQVKAQSDSGKEINWSGSLRSGTGILHLNGHTKLLPSEWPTVIDLQGKNVTLSNTKAYQAIVSPTVTLKFINQQLSLAGNVLLSQATLNLGGANEEADISNDIVFVDEKKPAKNSMALAVNGQLQVELGDKVQLNYQGLYTKLRGKITLLIAPNRPPAATGRVDLIEGKYSYRGETFKIRSGSYFLYAGGSLDDPLLNLQAIRTVKVLPQAQQATNLNPTQQPTFNPHVLGSNQATEALVGVNVRGSAKKQQLSLFSEPSGLSQPDILAYLLTGQPSSELGSASAQLLFMAISNSNSGSGRLEGLMKKVQQGIGLDELAIGSTPVVNPATQTAQQTTTVTVGKKLSKKLSVRYIAGVNQATNTLQLNYLLSKYWTVQSTTSSAGSGIDLLYTIERK